MDTNRNAFGNFETAHSVSIPDESGASGVRSVELVGLSGSGGEGRAIVEASQGEQSDEGDEDVGEELRSRAADSLAPGVLHNSLSESGSGSRSDPEMSCG